MNAVPVARRRRRGFLGALLAGLAAPFLAPRPASAQQSAESIAPAVKEFTRGAQTRPGRVTLDMPLLADNGHSVPLTVSVESPMTAADHVRAIAIVSERNPRPVIARFQLGPRAGRAQVVTRVRLAGSQRVVAVAAMSDGSYWYGTSEVNVTESACLDMS
jgi:sulfur-oxidizing protein SoxY